MELKGQVLETLEKNKGQYISGNDLAEKLYVSRNAVWKAVKALKEDGHDIQAVTHKGYCLTRDSDILSKASVDKHLGAFSGMFGTEVFKSLASTNTTLKELASKGAREGTVVIADEQSGGRGRLGRGFYSPAGTGIYFSLLLRPNVNAADATLITTAAAVAVAESIEAITGVSAKIKWVNDVFCHGRKVSGILTEGAFDMESGRMEFVVLGIGVNVTIPESGYPDAIADIVTAVCKELPSGTEARSRLIAEILKRFWSYYQRLGDKAYLKDYKARAFIIGQDIDVIAGNASKKARALDIDDDCRLIVRYEDGTQQALSSGEVSIRPRSL
jgi:BirA family transcriptional regulator, biotin operon repressor / biotin---[acetyl-CoA-carboxylase] ligase